MAQAAEDLASSPSLRRSGEYRCGPGCGLAHSSRWARDAGVRTSNFDFDDHGDVIGRLLPAAHLLHDGLGFERVFQSGTDPDMVQASPAVGRFPILGAITPPGI